MKITSCTLLVLVLTMSSHAVAGGGGRGRITPVRRVTFSQCDVPVSSIRLGNIQPSVTASFIHNGQVVSLVSPVLYGVNPYSQQYQQQSMHSSKELEQRIEARILERLGKAGVLGLLQPLVIQHCAKCHGADNPKAGFSVFGEMTVIEKLKAISRLLDNDPEKRMPKGKPIDDNVRGLLINELAKIRSTK